MVFVYKFSGCHADHIRLRFFPTPGARSACYTRLQKLVDAGYLTHLRLPSRSGIGSGKAFFTPGPAARAVLAKTLGLSRTELGRIRMAAPPVVAHHLAICDTRLAVELAAEHSAVFTLQEWHGDGHLRHRVTDPKTAETISLIPDSSFTLALPDGSAQTFLLEQDLGTLPVKRLRARLRGYLSRPADNIAPVLFVTLDRHRQDAIARWAYEEATALHADPTVFWLTTQLDVAPTTVLDRPIWQLVGGPAAFAISALVDGTPLSSPPHPTHERALVGGAAR